MKRLEIIKWRKRVRKASREGKKKKVDKIRQAESKIPEEFFFSSVSLGIHKDLPLPKQHF